MATRETVSSKLKLVVIYKDAAGNDKNRSTTLSHLKPNMAADSVLATA